MFKFQSRFHELSKIAHHIRPDQEWVIANKQKLLRQIHNSTASGKPETSWLGFLEYWLSRSRLVAPLRVTLVVFVILGMTISSWIAGVSASNASLPGEVLYKVKIATENTQLALTSAFSSQDKKAENKAKLQLQFAGRRSKEVKQLVAQKKPQANQQVPPTIQKLKVTIQEAQDNLKEVKKESPESVLNLAKDVTEKTSAIAQDLKEAAKDSLAQNVDIAKQVVETSKIVNDTGLQAIEVVLEDKQVTQATSNQEIKDLVQEKVDILIQNIADSKIVVEEVKQLSAVVTSTLEAQLSLSTSTLPLITAQVREKTVSSSVNIVPTEEVTKAGENLKQADKVAGEVKELLAENQVEQAIEKAKTLNDLTTQTQQVLVESKVKVNAALPALSVGTTASTSVKVKGN